MLSHPGVTIHLAERNERRSMSYGDDGDSPPSTPYRNYGDVLDSAHPELVEGSSLFRPRRSQKNDASTSMS
jgi:hypothetical protein